MEKYIQGYLARVDAQSGPSARTGGHPPAVPASRRRGRPQPSDLTASAGRIGPEAKAAKGHPWASISTARRSARPRARSKSEYRVLAEVTRRLMEIDDVKAPAAVQALYDNAAVWGTFAADVSMPENPLPDALKAQILSLYLWVERHSRQVGRGGAKIQPLVDREQGGHGRPRRPQGRVGRRGRSGPD